MNLPYVQGQSAFNRLTPVPTQFPYLTQSLQTEVAIIGGGVTGSIVAYYLAKAGIPTILLEKHRIAHGSTGITTSLLQYELDSKLKELEVHTSLEKAIRSYELGLDALKELDTFIATYGNECAYEKKDCLFYTAKQEEVGEIETEFELRKAYGFPVDLITEESNPFSFDLKAGIISYHGGAQLDPYRYTHQLLKVAQTFGLKVYENTEVLSCNYTRDGVTLMTSYGYTVEAKKVIVATGFNTERFSRRQFGIKTTTFNVMTLPVSSLTGWPGKVLIRDNEKPYHYLRTTDDGRLIIGGEDIPFIPQIFREDLAQEKYQLLEQHLKNMFPSIRPIQVAYTYCGAFASTPDNLGFLGPDPVHEQLWYALGYGANGILFALLGGLMLSQLYQGYTDPNLRLFAVDRFDGS